MRIKDLTSLIRIENIPCNALFYLLGLTFAYLLTGSFSLKSLTGLAAFLITYSGFYLFNDIMDKEADKKHSCNWRREGPITKGRIKVRDALIILITIIILGQALAYLVNITFFLLTLSINVISIFYSGLKLKEKWGAYLSMILLLEFIKISLGWASVNEGLLRAPLLMILGLSSFYTYTLAIYKEVTFKSKNFSLACKSLIIIGLIMYVIDAIRFARITLASVIFLSALLTGSFFIYKSFLKSNKDLGRFSLLGKLLIVPTLTLCLIILLLIL